MMVTAEQNIPRACFVKPIPGDMIGDKPMIGEHHYIMADTLFPHILKAIANKEKVVIAVGGPSGSGKSETASLIAGLLTEIGIPSYTLSCDNYPHKPPRTNEQYREELFAQGGEAALDEYLGTQKEIAFSRLEQIVADFKAGNPSVMLRIIDNPGNYVADDAKPLDCRNLSALVLEGTWSNLVTGIDVKTFLYSTPDETLAHRIARGRDPKADSDVLKAILHNEQGKLQNIADNIADIVINKQYQILRTADSLPGVTLANERIVA